jgi:hypothetical protein
MKQDNRVLNRVGARDLTKEEIDNVTGGLHTLTACTVDGLTFKDGDAGIPGEC